MSSAIAIKGSQSIGLHDYQPVSDGSQAVRRKWADERNYLRGSASDWLPIVHAAFRSIRSECGWENWDGEGAIAVSEQVIAVAEITVKALIALLPMGTPAPDIIPESDGEICIGWTLDAARMFSLSVGQHGNINFAGQFGREGAVHAWQPIDTSSRGALENSLQDVVRCLAKLYPPTASRRAA